MTQPDSSKEITLTIGELDALIKAASMRSVLEYIQSQSAAGEVSQKIQSQLAQPSEMEE